MNNSKSRPNGASRATRRQADDAKKLAEVEAALASAPPLPDGEVLGVGLDEIEVREDVTVARLHEAWRKVEQLRRVWANAKARQDHDAASHKDAVAQLKADRELLEREQVHLDSRAIELAKAEIEIERQRAVAKAGFVDELRALTQEVAAKRDELLSEIVELQFEGARKVNHSIATVQEALEGDRAQLAADRSEVQRLREEVQEAQEHVADQLEFLKLKQEGLERRYQERRVSELADADARVAEAEDLLRLERAGRENLEARLQELKDTVAKYGAPPELLREELDALRQEVRRLRDELSQRPPADEVLTLRQSVRDLADAQADALHWHEQFDLVDHQLRYQLMSVGELEVLRDERDVLSAQRETLRQALAKQQNEWEELQAKEGTAEPFPACTAYDGDAKLNRKAATRHVESLAALADEVRHRMATDSETAFFYSDADVRVFLGGLAASRLHLLQGISGTGKTSLPREFFRALGGEPAVSIVEVQSGWRDRDDLFGYYNAFEKRFVESEFTKALYRALLPANQDRPMVIVLDEMNLAHPEQYFGTMLSVLENSMSERGYVDLLTSAVPGLPRWFEDARLPLAANVWFVGTANHDETTVAFADKTYDRAHVQELPARHEVFPARTMGADEPVSYKELNKAFAQARRAHAKAVAAAKAFLDNQLHDEFGRFGVGWGNRLERQIDKFVPVVIAAGGTLSEAVDHLVATKLVRKLEDRFGVRSEDLDQLAEDIALLWSLEGGPPAKTLDRIQKEADRLRGGYGA